MTIYDARSDWFWTQSDFTGIIMMPLDSLMPAAQSGSSISCRKGRQPLAVICYISIHSVDWKESDKIPRVKIVMVLPKGSTPPPWLRWLNSARHLWQDVAIWEPPMTYQWQSCTHALFNPALFILSSLWLMLPVSWSYWFMTSCPDVVYSYLCFYHPSDI